MFIIETIVNIEHEDETTRVATGGPGWAWAHPPVSQAHLVTQWPHKVA